MRDDGHEKEIADDIVAVGIDGTGSGRIECCN